MIEAPHVQDIPPHDDPPGGAAAPAASKASLLIAAYRAARLSQRQTFRPPAVARAIPIQTLPPPDGMPPDSRPTADIEPENLTAWPPAPVIVAFGTEIARVGEAAVEASEPPVEPLDAIATAETDTVPAAAFAGSGNAPDDPGAEPELGQIGLGPCMMIRLNQIGLHSVDDLARANAQDLRSALGRISRLVDVEAWIAIARHLRGVPSAVA